MPLFSYHAFDFSEKCKGGNFDNIVLLYDEIKDDIEGMNFFFKRLDRSTPEKLQEGVFRTNCIDCLDRTNIAQCYISRIFLTKQLCAHKIISEGESSEAVPRLFTFLNTRKNMLLIHTSTQI